LDSAIQ
jgi:hypothetical protein